MKQKIGIIGLGLIGGSMALALKQILSAEIYGADKYFLPQALSLGIADKELTNDDFQKMDIIIIATPVNTIAQIALDVLDQIHPNCLVFDVGSTKYKISQVIDNHKNRKNFVLAHPIAGTEYSGPEAAFSSLFTNKMNIICDIEKTDKKILQKARKIFDLLQMKTNEMSSHSHDKHIAYVSHLSHISSFMLGKTVMDLEKDEKNIFEMAGSGFASTVRLAKSSPKTWTAIFIDNKENILQSLDEYIDNLNKFKQLLIAEEAINIEAALNKINHIKSIIDRVDKK
jgi:prephenate dehydrogenase